MTYIQSLTEFCCQYYGKNFPDQVIEEAKISLIDYFSALVWGMDSDYYSILMEYAMTVPAGSCSIIGTSRKTTAGDAAFINSVISHAMEIDDIHLGTAGLHPGVVIIPSVIALAEELNSSGEEVLKAIIIGYEVAGRIGKSISPSHRYRGFHATGTIGVFGSTAACAFIKKLSKDDFANALALASSQAGGTFAFLGGGVGVKYLHAGNSARNGLQSVSLTELGFKGPHGFLEHSEGFAKAYASDYELNRVIENFGESFEIMNIFRKKHFVCGHIFPAIDALQSINEEVSSEEILEIKIFTYKAAAVLTNVRPASYSEAKFSIPYCISSIVLFHEIMDYYSNPILLDKIFDLSRKITVILDEEYTALFPGKRKTRIELIMKSGMVETGTIDIPKGMPENPCTIKDITLKLDSALNTLQKRDIRKDLLMQIEKLEKQNNVNELMSLINYRRKDV
jgi:2-methylcitrate dehydratase PrpD